VSASNDHTLKVWDLQSAREVLTLAGHTDRVGAVAFTADGKRVVSASDDRSLKAWDLRRGALLDTFDGEVSLYTCAVSSQGNVICGGEAGRVHFLRIEESDGIESVEGDPGIGYEPTGRNT